MSEFTNAKRQYRIEACAEAMLTILRAKEQNGEYLPIYKKYLIPQIAKRVASSWQKDKYSHVISGKLIQCPDAKFIKVQKNWRDIRNTCNQVLKDSGIAWVRRGTKIGNEIEIAKNLAHLESISKGTAKQHNFQAELGNKRGVNYPLIQVKQLTLTASN
jgi:hypothetical protein